VINCGGISYATYRLVPLADELLRLQPDMFIFYEGHNEFLEDRTYAGIKHAPRWIAGPHEQLSRLRLYTLLRAGVNNLRGSDPPRDTLAGEVDAVLDWQGGIDQYRRDLAWQRDVIAHFEFNLRRLVQLAAERGVPLVLVQPVSNLDWPPFKAEHRADLSAADMARFDEALAGGRAAYSFGPAEALAHLKMAATIDPEHAGIRYSLGKCYLDLGQFEQAKVELNAAKDNDICPLRILTPMSDIIRDVAADTQTPLVDAEALFGELCPGRIPGPPWLVDHVHPSIEGHQRLANALLDELARYGVVMPIEAWQARRDAAYRQHLESLPAIYYARGQDRLRAEQGWAHGQSERKRE
jgi:lysophospholipase L1-like esterase